MEKNFKTSLLSTGELTDIARLRYPNVYRNNRGVARTGGRFIRYGIPEPKAKEKDFDLKAGDLVGYHQVLITPAMVGQTISVFTNIEIKGKHDVIKEGQVRFHNLIIGRGGISLIMLPNGTVIKNKITTEEVNKKI